MNSMDALKIARQIMQADWSYNYTEDYSAYKRGEGTVREVQSMIKDNTWTQDQVDLIIHEVKNILTLRGGDKEISQSNLDYWTNMINKLFKKAING